MIQEGTCDCGSPVTREVPPGRLGEIVSRFPFACDACVAQAEAKDAADAEAFRADQRVRRAEVLRRQSGVPPVLAELRLEQASLDQPPVAAARQWVDHGGGLLLTGNVGVGKTHLAASAAGSLLAEGRRVHWMSGPLMFARLASGMGTPEQEAVLSVLTGTDALIIDDLDKTRPTAYGAENVFLAVDGRVNSLAPLLVTTNLKLSELAAHWPEPFGEAIASRLGGYCRIVRMTGQDRRLGEAA